MSKIVSISEAASIALHSMVLIARSGTMVNVLQIAEQTESSKHHVAKILQRLVKDNYLASHRGPTGGFSLKKPASEISFLDIYEAIEGKVEVCECPLEHKICPFERCLMDNVTNQMTYTFKDYLKSQTLDLYIK